MSLKELCIECNINKTLDDESWFCEDCKKKIINHCWNYHKELQSRYL